MPPSDFWTKEYRFPLINAPPLINTPPLINGLPEFCSHNSNGSPGQKSSIFWVFFRSLGVFRNFFCVYVSSKCPPLIISHSKGVCWNAIGQCMLSSKISVIVHHFSLFQNHNNYLIRQKWQKKHIFLIIILHLLKTFYLHIHQALNMFLENII